MCVYIVHGLLHCNFISEQLIHRLQPMHVMVRSHRLTNGKQIGIAMPIFARSHDVNNAYQRM